MTDRETEAPERIRVMPTRWAPGHGLEVDWRKGDWDTDDAPYKDAEFYVRADRLAAMEPEPNARALYVRTDIDTAEEIARLRGALSDFVAMGEQYGWDEATTGRDILMRNARAALTDTASTPESNLHGADSNPVISHDATEARRTDVHDDGQACDAGDVRRKALEEAAEVADDYAGDCSTDAERVAAQIASAIRYATPPQPAPTVQEAAEWVEPMYTLAMLGLLTDEYQRSPDFRDAVDDALALSQRRFLSQQEGGENG